MWKQSSTGRGAGGMGKAIDPMRRGISRSKGTRVAEEEVGMALVVEQKALTQTIRVCCSA